MTAGTGEPCLGRLRNPPGARNGRVLLVNDAGDPATLWRTIPAPLPVPDACSETCPKHQWCPNYSSSLLTARNGAQVPEFASDWRDPGLLLLLWAGHHCRGMHRYPRGMRRENSRYRDARLRGPA